jgi:two-component system, cell cycle sensor histidine kinase DivJ
MSPKKSGMRVNPLDSGDSLPAKPALIGESEAAIAFERSRMVALFIAALLVPLLLVLDGPRDWRLAFLAATPTIPPMVALAFLRRFGVDTALAVQFGLGALCASVAAAAGFGFAVPALIVALMVIDSLLIGRRISNSPQVAALIGLSGFLAISTSAAIGGFEASGSVRGTLIWLVIPSLLQLGTAILVWRRSTAWRRKSDHDPMGLLLRSVDLAQREAGVLFDQHGRAEDVTGNIHDVVGLRAADALGRGLIERMHVLDRPAFLKAIAEAAGDAVANTLRLRLTRLDIPEGDTTFRWFEGRIFPIAGQMGSALMMMRDINEEIGILAADAARRRKQEEERQRRSGFLSDLSHDVRTPLNAIIGFAELLANPQTQPREKERITEYAGIVHRSGRDLLEVVTMLVEMTRVENGAFEFIEEPAKPSVLIDGLRETLSEATERRDFQIRATGDLDCLDWQVDRRAARQVLFGVGSTIIDQHVRADLCVHVERDAGNIRFAFSICGDEASRHAGRRTVTAGLSLEVAKALVGIMGGEISIDDSSNFARATLMLPIAGRNPETDHQPIALAEARARRLTLPHTVEPASEEVKRKNERKNG